MAMDTRIRAGRLRHRITIQTCTGTDPGATLEFPKAWTTFASCWADIAATSGSESVEAARVQADASHVIEIRYQAGVLPTMRVLHGVRNFEIVAVLDMEERHRKLYLLCKEAI